MTTPSSPSPSTSNHSLLERHHSRSSSQLSTLVGGFTPSSPSFQRPRLATASPHTNRSRNPSPTRPVLHSLQSFDLVDDDDDASSSGDSEFDGLMISSTHSTSPSQSKKGKRRAEPHLGLDHDSDQDPGADPLTRHASERVMGEPPQPSQPSLAQYIQQKRRQASAPYYNVARGSNQLFGPGGGLSAVTGTTTTTSTAAPPPPPTSGSEEPNGAEPIGTAGRARSRQASRRGTVSGLHLGSLPSAPHGSFFPSDLDSAMVMTPTTEEWRALGGQLSLLADIRAKDEARLALDRTGTTTILPPLSRASLNSVSTGSSDSSSIDLVPNPASASTPSKGTTSRREWIEPVTPPLRPSRLLERPDPVTPPAEFVKSSFGYQTSRSGFTHSGAVSTSFGDRDAAQRSDRRDDNDDDDEDGEKRIDDLGGSRTEPIKQSSTFVPSHRPQQRSESGLRPNLTRGSLSTPTGTPSIGGTPMIVEPKDPLDSTTAAREGFNFGAPSVSSPLDEEPHLSPTPLDQTHSLGAIDPRCYSAVTGRRSIHSFLIESEAGKGAYGTVQKAREKGPNGEPTGPTVIIKYIIKQRILADCWKKHKILGPIPVEVHVLDHLRRVPYIARQPSRRKPNGAFERPLGKPARRDSAPVSLKEGFMTGHPNICGMLDFFEDGEFYYLVMPQAGPPPSRDLFDYVDLHPTGLPPITIHSILTQLCSALDFLHSHNIVHRDIKDENIVLSSTGNVQLIDFGSAAYIKDGKKFDTFSGTLDFAAPEVLRGARYGGKEQDIWALGVLGYVLICGECPFWSPEEAMQGLQLESRAELALRAKVEALVEHDTKIEARGENSRDGRGGGGEVHNHDDDADDDGIERIRPRATMADAVDLVKRCLEVDANDRPTANWVCDHRFLLGSEGWIGRRGWEVADDDDDASSDSSDERRS